MSFLEKNKRTIGYVAYFVLISLVFLFFGFPSESVQAYIRFLAEDRIADSDFSMEKVSLSFPVGVKLHQAELTPKPDKDGLRLRAESIQIRPDPWAFIKGQRIYGFQGSVYGGQVRGTLDFNGEKQGRPYSLRMIMKDVDLKSAQLMQGIIDRHLEGILEGSIQYESGNGHPYEGTGKADLVLSGGEVEIALPLLELDTLQLDRLMIKSELKNRRLNLGQIEFNGPDINATLSGSINLDRELLKSRLNLRGEIEPLPEFFRKISDSPSTMELLKKRLKAGKLPFAVNGTLDEPIMRIM